MAGRDLKSAGRKAVGVQVPLRAPNKYWKINELPWIIPRRLIPHLLCDSVAGASFGACWIFQFARPRFGLQRTECVEVKGGNSVQPGASFCAPPPSCRLFAVLLAILIVVNPPDSASRRTLKNAALFRVLLFWFAQFSFLPECLPRRIVSIRVRRNRHDDRTSGSGGLF